MAGTQYPSYQTEGEIRASAILTNSYVVAKTWGQRGEDQAKGIEASHIIIDFAFTIGSLTNALIKVEYSHDGTTWYQHTSASTASGTSTISAQSYLLNATASAAIAVPLIKHPFVRVSAKGTGTVTSSLLAMDARFIS